MLKLPLRRVVLAWALLPIGAAAAVEPSWEASVEILGRSIAYGLKMDRMVSEDWAIGAGLSRSSVAGNKGQDVPITGLIPLFANRYFARAPNSWYLTGGLTLVTNPDEVDGQTVVVGTLKFPSFPVIVNAGVGYEMRQVAGFLFRAEGLLQQGGSLAPSLGFTLGYGF